LRGNLFDSMTSSDGPLVSIWSEKQMRRHMTMRMNSCCICLAKNAQMDVLRSVDRPFMFGVRTGFRSTKSQGEDDGLPKEP
jgi:hypothetical protein